MSRSAPCRKGGGTYPSEKLARRACRQLRKRAIDWFALNVYFCRQHQGWHVGTRRLGVFGAKWGWRPRTRKIEDTRQEQK